MENNIQENKVSILYNPEILLDPSKNYSCQENWNEDRLNALIGMIKSLDVFKNTTMNVIISNMKEDDFPQGLFGDQKIAYYPDLNEDLATFLKSLSSDQINFYYVKDDSKKDDSKTEDKLRLQYEKSEESYFISCHIWKISISPTESKLGFKIHQEEMKWGKTIPIINHDSYVSIENMNFWMDLKKQETFEHLAAIRQPVLVLGPRGSGKTTAVQTIVKRKMGNNKPFVAVNCNALNNSLADSELFGYVKGAYTGADKGKKGLVEEANGGCLFLDEVQDLSPETQGKLLKCIEEHTFQKVGSTKILNSNFFLICSSNRSLEELHSLLLEDFYDRISVFQIEMESIEDLKKEDGFLESVLPSIWDNYHKKTKNVFFLDYEKTKQNYPLLMEKLLSVLKENNLLGNFRDIEKLVAYLDLHIYNFNAAVDVNRNWKSAIEEWEKYIVERNRIVQEKNNVNKKEDSLDKFSIKNSDDDLESLIEYLKWDGMNKLFRKWLAQWSTEKYGSFNAAARALKKDKNVISRALNEDL